MAAIDDPTTHSASVGLDDVPLPEAAIVRQLVCSHDDHSYCSERECQRGACLYAVIDILQFWQETEYCLFNDDSGIFLNQFDCAENFRCAPIHQYVLVLLLLLLILLVAPMTISSISSIAFTVRMCTAKVVLVDLTPLWLDY